MFFLQAAEAPVIAQIGKNTTIRVRKLTMQEVVEWGAEILAERIDEATKDMSAGQKREFLTIYPPVPPDLGEMKRQIRTPKGVDRVLNLLLPEADVIDKAGKAIRKLSEDEIRNLMTVNGTGRKAAFAWELADLDDTSLTREPNAPGASGDDNNEEGADPLTKGGSRNSTV